MRTSIIAEISTSHGGERAWMSKFVESAALAGADYAKFQSFQVAHLAPTDSQYDWLKTCELTDADHVWLKHECEKVGVQFLTTAFTWDRVEFLYSLGLKAIKVGSGEAGDWRVLEEVSRYNWHIYLSTGLWTDDDMDTALRILHGSDVTLLHTVSEYPTPLAAANISRIAWLRKTTGLRVGYSDHTIGKDAALAAIGMGAAVVEVHHSLPGAPRRQVWDKAFIDLRRICEFARSVEVMSEPRLMLKPPGEQRPFVGRWQR